MAAAVFAQRPAGIETMSDNIDTVNVLRGNLQAKDTLYVQSNFDQGKGKTNFRQFNDTRDSVKAFYAKQHTLQTVAYNLKARNDFKTKTRAHMSVWDAMEKLNTFIDECDPEMVDEIQNLVATVHHEAEVQQSSILKEIFASNNKQQTLRRMLLGAGTAFFQQMGGTNVIAYYLPVVLTRSVGLSNRMALILSAVDSMSLMFWGSLASLVIDRVGRKRLMLMGVTGSSICFALVAVGLCYGGTDNRGMSILAVVFIFMYYVFYGLSLLSIPYMYPAEINSQKMRNIGTSFATTVNWVFVYLVVVVTPTAIESIHWKYYMLFAIFNVCFVPIIWRVLC